MSCGSTPDGACVVILSFLESQNQGLAPFFGKQPILNYENQIFLDRCIGVSHFHRSGNFVKDYLFKTFSSVRIVIHRNALVKRLNELSQVPRNQWFSWKNQPRNQPRLQPRNFVSKYLGSRELHQFHFRMEPFGEKMRPLFYMGLIKNPQ